MLLLWSGGCDSTFVLAERLKAKEPVRTISIVHPQFNHNEEQRLARKRIVGHFKRKKIVWPHIEVVVQQKYPFGHKDHMQMGGYLPAIWIGIACAYLDDDEDMGIAYIKGDNAIHSLGVLRDAFNFLNVLGGRSGKLVLPVEWYSKAMILDGLKRHKLLRKTWWCESPKKGRMCGRCSPCMTHKTARWVLANRNDFKMHGDYKPRQTEVPDQTKAKEQGS
jgi:7-cyano-7-deazaguanine synthase in queuosine biosynthesis